MYSLVLRKGKIELNLECDDREFVANQLAKIIRQASSKPVVGNPQPYVPPVEETVEPVAEPAVEQMVEPEVEQPVVREPEFQHITSEELQMANAQVVAPQVTINSLQNPVEPEVQPADFEQILNNEIQSDTEVNPVLKDENFIQYVQSKAAIEKLDFLIITAQYLAKYENMNTFSLKHINGKLMQNFTLIVDHTVLQSAILKELVTKIIDNGEEQYSEYMLTEKGLRSY